MSSSIYLSIYLSILDFVLTYKYKVQGKKSTEEEIKKSSAKREEKRQAFFDALERKGLEFEIQEPKVLCVSIYPFIYPSI